MYSSAVYFKRPSLYEYVTYKEQTAVSSHFSVIALVPMLLELSKSSRVLECGTGSGSMTLFLSEKLGHSGVLHTFDITENKTNKAKEFFRQWKDSFDLTANNEYEKWPSNVKYGTCDFAEQDFGPFFNEFYDAVYLDMLKVEKGILNAHKMLNVDGVIVVNFLHLSQLMKSLNAIRKNGLCLEHEVIIEPANRLWEMRRIKNDHKYKNKKLLELNANEIEENEENSKNETEENSGNEQNDDLNWTCRLEDKFLEKFKRGGLFFNYWSGFLVKFRKTK